jgi:hypothetical protein
MPSPPAKHLCLLQLVRCNFQPDQRYSKDHVQSKVLTVLSDSLILPHQRMSVPKLGKPTTSATHMALQLRLSADPDINRCKAQRSPSPTDRHMCSLQLVY